MLKQQINKLLQGIIRKAVWGLIGRLFLVLLINFSTLCIMIRDQNSSEIMDISAINHKDLIIEFSACDLLDNDDYFMLTTLRKQKVLKTKPKNKVYKSNHKQNPKENLILSKNINQQPLKTKNIANNTNQASEKETHDSCQTVTKSVSIKSLKTPMLKREKTNDNKICLLSPKIVTNKNQLLEKNRYRSKSSSSLHSFRKKSAIQVEDFIRKSITSSTSTIKSFGAQKIGKIRSQTIRHDFQQIKKKNENIIRNDYFQEDLQEQLRQSNKKSSKRSQAMPQTKKNEPCIKGSKKKSTVANKNSEKLERTRRK